MCDMKRCRNTDVAVIYCYVDARDLTDDELDQELSEALEGRRQREICERCWDRHGGKSAAEIVKQFKS